MGSSAMTFDFRRMRQEIYGDSMFRAHPAG